jgi:endoglucanase
LTVNLFEVLKNFMKVPAVTGFEEQRRKRIIEAYSKYCDSVSIDVIGNVIGKLGDGEKTIMIAGHYDQIGFMVTYIDEKGYAHFKNVGGWDPRVAYGNRVKIWTGEGTEDYFLGVIGTKAAHLTDSKDREKVPKITEMTIDFGAKSKEDALKMGVDIGCVVTPDTELAYLGKKGSDLIVAPAFDDICAIGSFIVALDELAKNIPESVTVYPVATVQEEVGLRGATVSGYNLNPWCSIAVDVTHAVAPGIAPARVQDVKLGKGPVIGMGANFTKGLWEIMKTAAMDKDIPFQMEGYPGGSGTDAWALQMQRGGRINGLISVPNRYMHSPNEVVSLQDLENIGKLLAETIRRLAESDLRHNTEVYRKV